MLDCEIATTFPKIMVMAAIIATGNTQVLAADSGTANVKKRIIAAKPPTLAPTDINAVTTVGAP